MSADVDRPPVGHLIILFAVSMSMLAFEILLVRLFEFSHWHHFAGLSVSLALLGLGTAGTFLALRTSKTIHRTIDLLLLAGTMIQAVGTLVILYLHSTVTLRPLFAAWDARELGRLLVVDFLAFVPFFGAGLAIGAVFARWPASSRQIYAVNLVGSAVGSLAASFAMAAMHVERILVLTAVVPALALAAFTIVHRWHKTVALAAVLCGIGLAAFVSPPEPASSDFKALSRILDLPDARILRVQNGLPGRLTLVRSKSLRIAPALSLEWTKPVPSVDAAVIGSDRVVPLPPDFQRERVHTKASLVGLPFHLRRLGRALILGTSTWQSQIAATRREVVWVEPDSRLLELARERGLAGPSNTLISDGAYRYIATTEEKFVVITVDAAFDGQDAATEDYLMTTEALAAALTKLTPDGLLAVPLKLSLPPNRVPRALATLRDALTSRGVEQPGQYVAVLRGLQDALILVSPLPFASRDIGEIRAFAEHWRFDLAWLPDITGPETNRYHRLEEPVFYLTAKAMFEGGPLPEAVRWFANAPVNASRPYFWRSLKWERLADFVHSLGRARAASYLDWTLLLATVTAGLATMLAFALIVLPLGRLPPVVRPFSRTNLAAFFALLGFGYLLLELAFFQRAILFLGEPVLTAAVVFAAFLLGSGVGSATAPRTAGSSQLNGIFLPIAATLIISLVILWIYSEALLEAPRFVRMGLIAMAIVPLAWAMGRPFPWALGQLAAQARWVPWAWAINGFASVIAASLATLISVEWGQSLTVGAAAVCYLGAALTARRWVRSHPPAS